MRQAIARVVIASFLACSVSRSEDLYVRYNQVGMRTGVDNSVLVFSTAPVPKEFSLSEAPSAAGPSTEPSTLKMTPIHDGPWGKFEHFGQASLSRRLLRPQLVAIGDRKDIRVDISEKPYVDLPATLLEFMRQQRCGHNPWLNEDCHTQDGRTAFGPLPAGTPIDVSGGWHDAGDMLKYLMTSEKATADLLLAYVVDPTQPHADQLLDEARWGLTWMLKMHPAADQLYHQVGDDRDHAGFRDPATDPVDYGWGKGGPRVAYAAEGKPQGLKDFQSESTGVANLAGVYSAAMGLSYQIWKDDPQQKEFADRCLKAGKEVYELGLQHPGVQQGNSYSEPYRYSPTIWAGAMEWGATELYRATGEPRYLKDAVVFAKQSFGQTWIGKEQTGHYQFFPFVNVAHFRLLDLDPDFQPLLAADYLAELNTAQEVAGQNPFGVGVPFIWCSNNLVVALATQCNLYKRISGSQHFDRLETNQLDWLLGRNPWGTTMFTGVGKTHPKDAHLMTFQLLHRPVGGGLVDGPVYDRIFKSLKGVGIREPDPLADFQGPAVYHDDGKDYSTNEPTLDGTAAAILMFALENSR